MTRPRAGERTRRDRRTTLSLLRIVSTAPMTAAGPQGGYRLRPPSAATPARPRRRTRTSARGAPAFFMGAEWSAIDLANDAPADASYGLAIHRLEPSVRPERVEGLFALAQNRLRQGSPELAEGLSPNGFLCECLHAGMRRDRAAGMRDRLSTRAAQGGRRSITSSLERLEVVSQHVLRDLDRKSVV